MSEPRQHDIQTSAMALMKQINSPDGYEPMPWTQIRWHTRAGQPLKIRLLAHILAHTVRKGHFSPFAVLVGRDGQRTEMRLENFEKLLNADMGNIRRAWRELVADGCTRNGTEAEGEGRLYICGNVPDQKGEDKAKPEVCTDLLPGPILKQTKGWEPERVEKFIAWWELRLERKSTVIADLVDLGRDIIDEDDDTALLDEWGVAPSRNKPHAKSDPEAQRESSLAREARLARTEGLRAPVKRLVQTSLEAVQSRKAAVYKEESELVQDDSAPATLLSETRDRQEPEAGRQNLQCAPPCNEQPLPNKQRSSPKVLPTPQTPVSAPVKLSEAESALFAQLATWKNDYEHCDFGSEEISRQNKGQVATVRRIVATAGGDMAGLVPYISEKLEKVNKRPAMGKRVRTGFGLILEWTDEYARSGPERARKEKEKREAFARAAEHSAALNKQLDQAAIAGALKEIKDPATSDRDRQLAKETLDVHGIQYGVEAAGAFPQEQSGEGL